MKTGIGLIVAFTALGSGANAQELTYGQAYASSAEFSASGGDTDIQTYGGGLEFAVHSLIFSADIGRISSDFGDVDIGSFAGEYGFSNGLSLGLEYAIIDFEGIDSSITSFFAVYESGAFAIGASAGDSDDLQDTVLGVFASYDVSENTTYGIEYLNLDDLDVVAVYSDYDGATGDFYASYVDLEVADGLLFGGSFDVWNGVALTGDYASFSADGGDGIDAYSIGAEYSISESIDIGISYGQVSSDGAPEDIDVISFGIEFETGRRTSSRSRATEVLDRAVRGSTGSF